MAKQQYKQQSTQSVKKQTPPQGNDAFTYVLRNFVVVLVLAAIIFGVDHMNKKQGQLQAMYQEFSQLRQTNGNPERMQELYNQIMEIQSDTSFFKKVTRGYYWAVHDMAIGGKENVEEIKSKAIKPLTREDKFAMRVGIWPLIDHINKSTPKDAVIYLPKADSSLANNGRWNYIYHPGWMEYFLYPRLCVAIGQESDQPGLAERVTHVVIVEGKGYDKLRYDVPMEQRVQEAVLPINAPKTKQTE